MEGLTLENKFNMPFLSTKEVSEILRKSEKWVLLHKEEIGFSKRARAVIFKRKDIENWVEEGYCPPARTVIKRRAARS